MSFPIKSVFYLIIIFSFVKAGADEGFYKLESIPQDLLAQSKLEVAQMQKSYQSIAMMSIEVNISAPNVAGWCGYFETKCKDGEYKKWNPQSCELSSCKTPSEGKDGQFIWPTCSGVLIEGYAVTAQHCNSKHQAWMKNPNARVFFTVLNHQQIPVAIPFISTVGTDHDKTVFSEFSDVSVYGIDPNATDEEKELVLAQSVATYAEGKDNEAVYTFAIPDLSRRTIFNRVYEKSALAPVVSIGKVVDANTHKKSFCEFTNYLINVNRWKLEDNCDSYDYSVYPENQWIRQERAPLLTNTDMTSGVSGAPLFNAQGELLGIGSLVLSDNFYEYYDDRSAVYSNSAAIKSLIQKIKREKNK